MPNSSYSNCSELFVEHQVREICISMCYIQCCLSHRKLIDLLCVNVCFSDWVSTKAKTFPGACQLLFSLPEVLYSWVFSVSICLDLLVVKSILLALGTQSEEVHPWEGQMFSILQHELLHTQSN